MQPQVIHDIEGELGNNIGFFPETAEESERVVEALQAEGVSCGTRGKHGGRDWHIYKYVDQIMEKMPSSSDGCPWRCPKTGEEAPVEYSPDMCPNTLELLSRQVTIEVNQWWTIHDCKQVAGALTKVFDAFYTRDSKYENWLEGVTAEKA